MARPFVDPNRIEARVNARVPAYVRRFLARLGGNGRGAVSIGLRRLAALRRTIKDGEDAVALTVPEFVNLMAELERYRKAGRK